MIKRHYVLATILGVSLLALFLIGATMSSDADRDTWSTERDIAGSSIGSYSGDDPYDPAAGGNPEGSVDAVAGGYSGDDAYDPAAGGNPEGSVVTVGGGYSGDDAYDPAAGGSPEGSVVAAGEGYSGDR